MTTQESVPATTAPDDDTARLAAYVDVWWLAVGEALELAEQVPDDAWTTPTELPGWTARDVLAHLAHLEAVAVGAEHTPVDVGEAPHVRNDMGRFCEEGVVARRDSPPRTLVHELRAAATTRRTALAATPPTDPTAPAPGAFGAIGWDTETFLGNRPLDVWMHALDIRRAVGLPGEVEGPAASYVATKLLRSLPFVVGKRAQAPVGTTVVLDVAGLSPVAVEVGADGRAREVDVTAVASPSVRLSCDLETYVLAAGGRGTLDPAAFGVEGDRALADRVLASLAVTP
ncbi:maleylpyruvate isomerase family mycothiol-dependent enzyme [Nocardioides sp. ChNu-153]|uniref:maleylpyruvate isomerase family mycothiol-dependent enzyme n=1 Tax=Nocardioides sp. ChNu-153 TaxID=2779364 RepID=UPI00264A9B5E|nr:maleylpyruvate isomerase family mycothiol-dependent enzyme [Nocardioides sp. ChNu-153]MDN7121009.1 maleylpyruvate isomerase family mycothiol-dependent enzyme [Nocardioides sp. ChNu-153]